MFTHRCKRLLLSEDSESTGSCRCRHIVGYVPISQDPSGDNIALLR